MGRNRITRLLCVLAALLGFTVALQTLLIPAAAADESASPGTAFPLPPTAKNPKLDSQLLAVATATDAGGAVAGLQAAREHRLFVSGNNVRVILRAGVDHLPTIDAIRASAGVVEAEYSDLVQGLMPVTALRRLANSPAIRFVAIPQIPIPLAVTNEGVAATNAAAWQAAGWSGTGVKIGVIDLGFIGYTARQASGDLPTSLTTADFGCGGVDSPARTEHGTA